MSKFSHAEHMTLYHPTLLDLAYIIIRNDKEIYPFLGYKQIASVSCRASLPMKVHISATNTLVLLGII